MGVAGRRRLLPPISLPPSPFPRLEGRLSMTSAVDGLVSGLQTSTLISQLMQVEAAPQNRLKAKVTTAQTAIASYQSVNTRVTAMKTAGDTINTLSTWRAIKASSSSPSVTATAVAGTNTAAGTTAFNVTALARSQ